MNLLRDFQASTASASPDELISAGLKERQQFGTAAAVPYFERAALLAPHSHVPFFMLANAATELFDLDRAALLYEHARDLQPGNHLIRYNLGLTQLWRGYTDAAIAELRTACELNDSYVPAQTAFILALHNSDRITPDEIAGTIRHWGSTFRTRYAASALEPISAPATPKPLRVGFVSGDFRTHSVAHFFEPIICEHDRERFAFYLYSNSQRHDKVTERLRNHAGAWRDVWALGDDALLNLVRHDKIDILVDLAGHTDLNRLALFARRAAPVQITYLGYPNSTGLPTMDYRITDARADPPPDADRRNVERLIRLPDSQWCFRPSGNISPSTLPARNAGFVTFGSFNNLAKISDTALDCWIQIMSTSKVSRLRITRVRSPERAAEITTLFEKAGISTTRIDLVDYQSDAPHGQQFAGVDIALDPYPYNGVTTTCEALAAGVPVISLCGAHCASRSGLSILSEAGLAELVGVTPRQYVDIAVSLANDIPRLERHRLALQRQFSKSSLRNEARFARHFEAALLTAWEDHRLRTDKTA